MNILKVIAFSITIFSFISSCASDQNQSVNYFENLPKLKGFKKIQIFKIRNKIFTKNCDHSNNKLFMKYSNENKNWKRVRYINTGCE